jgi:hypothetical protein
MKKTQVISRVGSSKPIIISAKVVITQRDLKKWWGYEQERLELQAKMKIEMDEILEKRDSIGDAIRSLLTSGTPVEEGKLVAAIVDGRCCPKWKEAFIEIAGFEAAQAVIMSTTPDKVMKISLTDKVKEKVGNGN